MAALDMRAATSSKRVSIVTIEIATGRDCHDVLQILDCAFDSLVMFKRVSTGMPRPNSVL